MAREKADAEIIRTVRPGHAREIAGRAALEGKTVVAVGGDGTVNETASGLAGTNTLFGIIPKGSGNGLALALKLPDDPEAACSMLLKAKVWEMDIGKLNDRYFFNIAGVGLDAKVGWAFNNHPIRGLLPYYYLTVREVITHEMPPIHINLRHRGSVPNRDEGVHKHEKTLKPLLIAIANGQQYGAGGVIAPKAKLNDGLFHVVIIPQLPIWKILTQIHRFFKGKIDTSPYVKTLTTASVTIQMPRPLPYHLDGEPFCDAAELRISLLPKALKVLVSPDFTG